jgi:hypothetical protein
MHRALTGAGESDVKKQQLTPRASLNGLPATPNLSTPSLSTAMADNKLDAVKRASCRE